MAITTPLPEAFECRRCFAEFSSNSQLHKHIRESHDKRTGTSAERFASKSQPPPEYSVASLNPNETTPSPSATTRASASHVTPLSTDQVTPAESTSKVTAVPAPTSASETTPSLSAIIQIAPSATPRASASLSADQVTPQTALLADPVTPQAAAPGPVTPPPTYRAVSPSPPTYEPASKTYLTMADLYMRYAPRKSVKSMHSASKPVSKPASYLTIQDLYERFKKPVVRAAKWDPGYLINRSSTFDFKQSMESSSHSIRSSAVRVVYDLKTSQIDFF